MIESILTFGMRHRIQSAVIIVLLSILAAWQLPKLRIDKSDEGLISESNPGWADYHRTVDAFGSDNTTLIYLKAKDLWTRERLRELDDFAIALGDIEHVEEVDSLITALNIRDKGEFADAGPLIDIVPKEQKRIDEMRADALYSPILRGNVISKGADVTAVSVTVGAGHNDTEFNLALYHTIERLIEPLRKNFDAAFQIGAPRLSFEIERGLYHELRWLVPLAVLILVGTTVIFLRVGWGAGIPLFTSAISILWTFGFMAWVDIPVTLLTATLPALVIVVGSTEDIHMLTAYLEGIGEQTDPDRHRAVRFMAVHVGLPIFITSATTAVGFLANSVIEIPLIQEFAYASSFAMIANLVATILIVPLLLGAMGPVKSRFVRGDHLPTGTIGRIVKAFEVASDRYPGWVIGVTAALVIGLGAMATQIRVTNDPLSYFEPDHPLVRDANTLHRDLSGVQIFDIVLEGAEDGAFRTPEGLRQLASIQDVMERQGTYDKTLSLADVIALVHQEMHHGDAAFLTVPDELSDIDLYLLIFSRRDLEPFVTPDYRRANIFVRHNLSDSHTLNARLDELRAKLPGILAPTTKYAFTGRNLMINGAVDSLVSGQAKSLLLLFGGIFLIFTVLYSSRYAGLLSLVPNLIPVTFSFGTMAIMGIPLNPGTAMVAAVAIGVTIDNTIHLITRYGEECRARGDQQEAVRIAVRAEAVPIISTSVALALGFVILTASDFSVVARFGGLAAATMIYAMVADLLVMPILLRRVSFTTVWDLVALKVKREALLGSPLFEGMSKYQIKKTILLSHLQEFAPGDTVITKTSDTQSLYVVLDGCVEVAIYHSGDVIHLARLEPGQVFGEIGFAGETKRTATVKALATTTVMRIDTEGAGRALRFYPRIASRLYRNVSLILSSRLAETDSLLAGRKVPSLSLDV